MLLNRHDNFVQYDSDFLLTAIARFLVVLCANDQSALWNVSLHLLLQHRYVSQVLTATMRLRPRLHLLIMVVLVLPRSSLTPRQSLMKGMLEER